MTRIEHTPQSQCSIGVARADITPPVGIYHRMWGAAMHERAEGIHRPLTATALYLASGNQSADAAEQVFVAIDHCLFSDREADEILRQVESVSGVAADKVLLCYSHTHGAGLLLYDRSDLPGGDLIPGYIKFLASEIAKLVHQARRTAGWATITYGRGHCDLARYRDFWDEESQQFVCGYNPDEPADDTVVVARITASAGDLLATVVNYACHPTTLAWENRLISPDYPGAMREVIEQATGAPCIFFQGTSGELGPHDGYTGATATADRNGRQLGYNALAALTALPPAESQFCYRGPVISGATLGIWRHEPVREQDRINAWSTWMVKRMRCQLPYRADLPTIEQARRNHEEWLAREEEARAAVDAQRVSDCRAMVERNTRLMARLQALPSGPTYPLRVCIMRMGDALWVAVQGESYSLLQRELRNHFPDTPLVVISLAHSWGPSYLPPRDVYGKGIYQESIAILAPGSLEALIATIRSELTGLMSAVA